MLKLRNIMLVLLTVTVASFCFYYIYNKIALYSKTEAMLKMSYWEFDQSEKGWRSLANPEAVKVIDRYVELSATTPEDKVNLNFHAGQLYAELGDYQAAIERFRISKHLSSVEWALGWNAYVDATIAFLEGNSVALAHAKTILENQKDFAIIHGTETLYPNQINLKVVERLVEGLALKKSYRETY